MVFQRQAICGGGSSNGTIICPRAVSNLRIAFQDQYTERMYAAIAACFVIMNPGITADLSCASPKRCIDSGLFRLVITDFPACHGEWRTHNGIFSCVSFNLPTVHGDLRDSLASRCNGRNRAAGQHHAILKDDAVWLVCISVPRHIPNNACVVLPGAVKGQQAVAHPILPKGKDAVFRTVSINFK